MYIYSIRNVICACATISKLSDKFLTFPYIFTENFTRTPKGSHGTHDFAENALYDRDFSKDSARLSPRVRDCVYIIHTIFLRPNPAMCTCKVVKCAACTVCVGTVIRPTLIRATRYTYRYIRACDNMTRI